MRDSKLPLNLHFYLSDFYLHTRFRTTSFTEKSHNRATGTNRRCEGAGGGIDRPRIRDQPHVHGLLQESKVANQYEEWVENKSGNLCDRESSWGLPKYTREGGGCGDRTTIVRARDVFPPDHPR